MKLSADPQREALYAKIGWRLIPFLFACYMIALIDRFNIGFAKLQFQQDLGINDAAFGLAAGMFSLGYIVFEVPSNLLLHRVGVRLTLLRIMALWGAVTVALMFASSATHFYVLRFLLGLAEAGFFPGILLYLTYWFPEELRGRVTTMFVAALPVGGMIGGPVSGWIMDAFNGVWGLRGWQWLFLLEGLPAIAMGVAAYFILANRPGEADWLSSSEKEMVAADLDRSFAASQKGELDFGAALRKPAVWLFTLIYLGYYFALTSISTWWPTLLKSVGAGSATQVGLLSGAISAVAAVGMVLIGRSSDRMGERRWHVALCGLTGAAAFLCLPLTATSLSFTVALMMIATTGIFTVLGLFWTLPSAVLSGRAAAGGIALISSIGNFAGFLAPIIIGSIKDKTGSLYIGLSFVAILLVGAMTLLLVVVPKSRRVREAGGVESAKVAA